MTDKQELIGLIVRRLESRHPPDAWAFAPEVETGTGYPLPNRLDALKGRRVIDAFAISLWPGKSFLRVAYEIKLQRSDWLAELKNPTKNAQARYLSDEFWFVLGPGVFREEDLRDPALDQCGIMLAEPHGSRIYLKPKKRPYLGAGWPMPEWFVASFLRRVRNWALTSGSMSDRRKGQALAEVVDATPPPPKGVNMDKLELAINRMTEGEDENEQPRSE